MLNSENDSDHGASKPWKWYKDFFRLTACVLLFYTLKTELPTPQWEKQQFNDDIQKLQYKENLQTRYLYVYNKWTSGLTHLV